MKGLSQLFGIVALASVVAVTAASAAEAKPNFLLIMADDQGYGETGYYGHPIAKTPNLDKMAAAGLRLDRYYAAHPFCSPTRASVMTGRHPNRSGCFHFRFTTRPQEITVAEALQTAGYTTGHFGKWHIGPIRRSSAYSPVNNGFDESLSVENLFEVDPALQRNGATKDQAEQFQGDGSVVVAREALKFIAAVKQREKPFLAVVWFSSIHGGHTATDEHRKPFADLPDKDQHFYGELYGLDQAVGILRDGLRKMQLAEDTLVWYTSDNGGLRSNSMGPLSGKKGSLLEGGIRVPCVLEWPARITKPSVSRVPANSSDILPTLLTLAGVDSPDRPLDGISLVDLIDGTMTGRPLPMGFWKYSAKNEKQNGFYLPEAHHHSEHKPGQFIQNYKHPVAAKGPFGGEAAWIDGRYKLMVDGNDAKVSLYDVEADPSEQQDIADQHPGRAATMKEQLDAWRGSVERSLTGADYD